MTFIYPLFIRVKSVIGTKNGEIWPKGGWNLLQFQHNTSSTVYDQLLTLQMSFPFFGDTSCFKKWSKRPSSSVTVLFLIDFFKPSSSVWPYLPSPGPPPSSWVPSLKLSYSKYPKSIFPDLNVLKFSILWNILWVLTSPDCFCSDLAVLTHSCALEHCEAKNYADINFPV